MKTNITLSAITHTIVEITGSKLAGGTVDLAGGGHGPLCPPWLQLWSERQVYRVPKLNDTTLHLNGIEQRYF